MSSITKRVISNITKKIKTMCEEHRGQFVYILAYIDQFLLKLLIFEYNCL